MTIEVKPGDDEQVVHVFPQKGHEAFTQPQSALKVCFKLQNDPKCPFRRNGNDLIYTHTLSLEDALQAQPVHIQTLDNKSLIVSVDKTITPQLVHCVEGQGMPVKGDPNTRGNLYIKFNIVFPAKLKSEFRQQIIDVLG